MAWHPWPPPVRSRVQPGGLWQAYTPTHILWNGGRIYSPYSGTYFSDRSETDIEHIVARSEAHDSGLCAVTVEKRKEFARDLANLTLASPSLNRHQKGAKDLAEWLPTMNQCWYANQVVVVKRKYSLTMDLAEAEKAREILNECTSTAMIFAGEPTATPTPTGTPTPAPTATLTPTPTATIDPELYCTLIDYAPGDERWPSTHVPLLQNDTVVAYRNKYGENIEDLDIFSVDHYLDGRTAIWYVGRSNTWNIRRVVAEFYRGCEFLGHTNWLDWEY